MGDKDVRLITLAYQAVTLMEPTRELLELLSQVGIERTLEVLLVMQQSPKKVKNPLGFIKKAIQQAWTPYTTPSSIPRNQKHHETPTQSTNRVEFPFYNWLEQE